MQTTTTSTRTFMPPPDKPKKRAHRWLRRLFINKRTLPWLIVIVLVLFSGFMVWQYREARDKLQARQVVTTQQANSVLAKVGKLILLPNEKPIVGTITDVSQLKGQVFYADAHNGDITLAYTKAKKAILYRPSANIIINVVSNVTVTPNQ